MGHLYSKEAVLEGLLDRSALPETAAHIKNLKDVKNLNFTPNPAYKGEEAKNGGYIDDGKSAYICPVIGLEMTGKYKFCFLWGCGCVMSERALKEIKTYTCHKCLKPFTDNDIVILNAQDEDLKCMEENILLRKSERKSKKRTANGEASSTVVKEEKEEEKEVTSKKIKKEKHEKQDKGQTAKSKIKVEAPQDPAYKKAKEDYSVAKDPKASEVLKSLFTTHKNAAEQTRAHWVTYNPYY